MPDSSAPRIGVPTNWQQMCYCIVAALHCMGDDGPWWGGEIQSEIQRMFATYDTYCDWQITGAHGKAWERAMSDLRKRGIVMFDDTEGHQLAEWIA